MCKVSVKQKNNFMWDVVPIFITTGYRVNLSLDTVHYSILMQWCNTNWLSQLNLWPQHALNAPYRHTELTCLLYLGTVAELLQFGEKL